MFGHVLREAGLEVGPGRLADALRGLDQVELTQRDDVYWTLRQTLVSRAEDLETFDNGFAAWFEGIGAMPAERSRLRLLQGGLDGGEGDAGDAEETTVPGWSEEEVLRRKDFALLREDELAEVRRLVGRIAAERPE